MNDTNETLADIVREMRDHGGPDYNWAASKGDLRKLADRIEAAAERERYAAVKEWIEGLPTKTKKEMENKQ